MAKGQYIQPLTVEKTKLMLIKQLTEVLTSEESEDSAVAFASKTIPLLRKAKDVQDIITAMGSSKNVLTYLIQ